MKFDLLELFGVPFFIVGFTTVAWMKSCTCFFWYILCHVMCVLCIYIYVLYTYVFNSYLHIYIYHI